MVTDQVTVGNLISTAAGAIMPIATSVVSFLMIGRTVRRERDADVEAKIAPVAARLSDVATKVEQHVPRSEIQTMDRAVLEIATGAVEKVDRLADLYARLDERQMALGGELREIKDLVKEQRRDTKAGFEKMQDCLIEISRKVG